VDILGLSYIKSMKGAEERVAKWLNGGDNSEIVSGHAPDYVPDLADLDVDLCLAAHTHGGQVRIGFFGPLVKAPMRFNCPPSITIIRVGRDLKE